MTPRIVEDVDDEFDRPSELDWDEVVDVICAGAGPGAVAHAVLCSDLGLTVELADAVAPSDVDDPDTSAYLAAMNDDLGLGDGAACLLEVPVVRAEPVAPRTDRRARIEPFIGSRVRDWSAGCAVSVFGVLYTAVPEAGMIAMRTDGGESIRAAVLREYRPDTDCPGSALTDWLAEQARTRDLGGYGVGLQRLIFEDGRVAGAAVGTASETTLIRARRGVALSTAAVPAGASWPTQPDLRGTVAQVAIVSRTGSRFGRVELLAAT